MVRKPLYVISVHSQQYINSNVVYGIVNGKITSRVARFLVTIVRTRTVFTASTIADTSFSYLPYGAFSCAIITLEIAGKTEMQNSCHVGVRHRSSMAEGAIYL